MYKELFGRDCSFLDVQKENQKQAAVHDESVVPLQVRSGGTGRITLVDIKLSDTVRDLKAKIEVKDRICPGMQRLIFAGRQLEDGCTLTEYNIEKGSTIHLMLKLRGC